jgi:hypothetical protein
VLDDLEEIRIFSSSEYPRSTTMTNGLFPLGYVEPSRTEIDEAEFEIFAVIVVLRTAPLNSLLSTCPP